MRCPAGREDVMSDEILLDLVRFYAHQRVPRGVIQRATRIENWLDPVSDSLVYGLRTAVLGEDGGDVVSDWVTVLMPLRPRWIPRWLWKRIPTREATWTLTARPKWTYPHSSIQVPDLGPPVRIAVHDGLRRGDDRWRDDG